MDRPSPQLLLTGATGFVGSELLGALGDEPVRCLVRDAAKLAEGPSIEAVEADVMERETLDPALDGIEEAYYLVHSMEPGGGAGSPTRTARRPRTSPPPQETPESAGSSTWAGSSPAPARRAST